MDKLIAFLSASRLWLENNIGLGAAFAVLCLVVFLAVWGFRKLFPNAWVWLVKRVPSLGFDETPVLEFLDKTVQALPGTVLAAVLGALSTGGSVKAAALAALAGPLMAIAHHILQAIPWIPYLGKLGKGFKFSKTTGASGLLILLGCAIGATSACAFLGKGGPVYPVAVKCLPPEQVAVDLVKSILLAGLSDWKQQLDDAALKYGPSAVMCIVNSLTSEWSHSNPTARTSAARARGDEFLAEHPAKVEQ